MAAHTPLWQYASMMSGISLYRRWRGPPLVLQILGLLLAGLVVAQLVTLLLTIILPPAPTPQHSLTEIGAALQGVPTGEKRPDPLERIIQPGPPDLSGAGWLISTRSERELAGRLGVDPADVRLAFYTPLPFAGMSSGRKIALKADDGPVVALPDSGIERASLLVLAQATLPPPPAPPGGNPPADMRPPARDMLPPGMLNPPPRGDRRGRNPTIEGGVPATRAVAEPLIRIDPTPFDRGAGGIWIGGDRGETVPEILRGPRLPDASAAPSSARPQTPGSTVASPNPALLPDAQTFAPGGIPPRIGGPGDASAAPGPFPGPFGGQAARSMPFQIVPDRSTILPAPAVTTSRRVTIDTPRTAVDHNAGSSGRSVAPATPRIETVEQRPAAGVATSGPAPAPPAEIDIRRPDPLSDSIEPLIPLSGRAGGLFGLAPSPFVEGDFVAALHLGDGQWAVVKPAPEGFPNAWQRRVLLWFLIAFAVVAPLGWLFARRIVKPLSGFASAAERLGRDPTAAVLDLDGPAEVGRAARAFNVMQSRLKSFVDDRTAMIGAISHDLRTPLTRLRFRLEDVDDDDVRAGMIDEVEEMEAMITSVLAFIRDASSPGVRERLDLGTILEDVVEDATMVGGDVTIERSAPAPVEVDVLGMRRLVANLVENAVKYGDRARIRLHVDLDEAVAEVCDDGPGLPEEDYERAFEPFYRAANAVSSEKRGSGLGLAVCRSIARAHGGDVRFARSARGFMTELRVPLSQIRAA